MLFVMNLTEASPKTATIPPVWALLGGYIPEPASQRTQQQAGLLLGAALVEIPENPEPPSCQRTPDQVVRSP